VSIQVHAAPADLLRRSPSLSICGSNSSRSPAGSSQTADAGPMTGITASRGVRDAPGRAWAHRPPSFGVSCQCSFDPAARLAKPPHGVPAGTGMAARASVARPHPTSSSRKTRSGRPVTSQERCYLSSIHSAPLTRVAPLCPKSLKARSRAGGRALPPGHVVGCTAMSAESAIEPPATGVNVMVAHDLAPTHHRRSNTNETSCQLSFWASLLIPLGMKMNKSPIVTSGRDMPHSAGGHP
jgi:hypothetical protein